MAVHNDNNPKSKKLITTIGMVIVAIIFLTSYASYANNNIGQSTSTTTTASGQTYFVSGSANAIVSNYSNNLNIMLLNASQNSSVSEKVTGLLGGLQSNGSVQNYFYNLGTYQVYLGSGINAYTVQSLLNKSVGNQNFRIVTNTYVTLPNTIKLSYNNAPVTISLGNKQYSVKIAPLKPINSTVSVSVQALVTANGSVYQNQIRVNYTG